MQKGEDGALWFSPTDLVRFVESPYASFMDRCFLEAPDSLVPDDDDPLLSLLMDKGNVHERSCLESLTAEGRDVAEIPDGAGAFMATKEAIAASREVIYQARLEAAPIQGFADFLKWVPERSEYAVWDTKLAATVRRYYLIQLCCYADMLEAVVGKRPAEIGIVLGTGEAVAYRTDDFYYYYLGVKRAFLELMDRFDPSAGPVPDMRADHGRWTSHANAYLDEVDHLVRVAGISRGQVRKLEAAGIGTLTALAQTEAEAVPKMDAGVFRRLREQASLQQASIGLTEPAYRVIRPSPDDPRRGLALLPPPSPLDVYFDMEGDPLVEGGLEYLFGAVHLNDSEPRFWDAWGFDAVGEKRAFEQFIDWVINRWREDPTMHVYHYAPYEVTTLKRLVGEHATREEEVDHLLRSHVFVDLYTVVNQGVRVGTPSYSLKDVEMLYLTRRGEVGSGAESIIEFERFLRSGDPPDWTKSEILGAIRDYNKADCESTWRLAEWLRERQAEAGISWHEPGREVDPDVRPLNEDAQRRRDLAERLLQGAESQTAENATVSRMLAHLLEFHRREEKPVWWSFFDRHDMTPEQLVEDVTCIGDATLESGPIAIKRSLGYWYSFDPDQDTKIEAGDTIYAAGLHAAGMTAEEVDLDGRLLVKVGPSAQRALDGVMPARASFLRHTLVGSGVMQDAIELVSAKWADSGTLPRALPNLFDAEPPPLAGHDGGSLLEEGEDVLRGTARVVQSMEGGTLAIQGPPGAGKTYTASHVIKELIDNGHNVGVVSNSHEAVFNVLRKVNNRYDGELDCLKVGGEPDHPLFDECPGARFARTSADGASAYGGGLIGGTAWLFSRDDMAEHLDYLFVDEAGQVSLANLVGMSRAATNLVLLGDQMQLAQPLQGTHPDESGSSALEYVLGAHATVPDELGIFLPTTYRLHPGICSFISGAIYEDRLLPEEHTVHRVVRQPAGDGTIPEAGIWFVPVEHEGNLQASDKEVDRIAELVEALLSRMVTDKRGDELGPLGLDDILFVAPYNMQVRRLRRAMPEARVASVDKFQGQQAPVVIVSLCRSYGESETGGRGLDFVLDRNRLNVAVSRAESLAIVVGDARLALTPATSVESMRRLNLLARLIASNSHLVARRRT